MRPFLPFLGLGVSAFFVFEPDTWLRVLLVASLLPGCCEHDAGLVLVGTLETGLGELENAIEAGIGSASLMLLDLLWPVLRTSRCSHRLEHRELGGALLRELGKTLCAH